MKERSAQALAIHFRAAMADTPLDQSFLLALSGGRDSVALLHLLLEAGYRQLTICHFDHALRPESARDADFVQSLGDQHQLPVRIAREDVRAHAKRRHVSLETAARDARYDFLARTATELSSPHVLLAHHADDQVETFLLNLFRGAGGSGLKAMRPVHHRQFGDVKICLLRPLLAIWRSELDHYLQTYQLVFREDSSNAELGPTRNRFRLQILPQLETFFGREIRPAIWRSAEILRAEDDYLQSLILPQSPELSVPALRALPLALQRRTIHHWLQHQHLVPEVNFETVERVRRLLSSSVAKVNLAKAWHVRRRNKRLFLEKHG